MCPYLEESGSDNYCGMNSRRLGERRVRGVCETGSYDTCSSFYTEERYDRHEYSYSESEADEECEREYEYAEDD